MERGCPEQGGWRRATREEKREKDGEYTGKVAKSPLNESRDAGNLEHPGQSIPLHRTKPSKEN